MKEGVRVVGTASCLYVLIRNVHTETKAVLQNVMLFTPGLSGFTELT